MIIKSFMLLEWSCPVNWRRPKTQTQMAGQRFEISNQFLKTLIDLSLFIN
jgi:hypothetical protein